MDKDLELIQTVRRNKEFAKMRADFYLTNGLIDGVVLIFNLLDIRENTARWSPLALAYRAVHTEAYTLGNCASQAFQKQLLHRVSDYHKQIVNGKHSVHSGIHGDKELATRRIIIEVDEHHKLDALLAVWGCSAEKNQELLERFSKDL